MKKSLLSLGLAALIMGLHGTAFAAYQSDSDTGANALDYIENKRRAERENALTDEQKKLLEDAAFIKEHLREPLDPTKNVPTTFEGDDLVYDQNTGEFKATGKVHIVQMDAHQFDAVDGDAHGNTIKQEIEIPGMAHVLQMTPGQSRITLDGYQTFYNYGKQTGTMGEAAGKVDHQYVTGKKFEFYPDHVVIYQGTATKCSAKNPDYHLSGDKITIWPNDKMIIEHAKFWLKNVMLYKKDRVVQDIKPGAQGPQYPKVGYSKSDGVWISQVVTRDIMKNMNAFCYLYYGTKRGMRSNAELRWANAGSSLRLAYGYYADYDDNWIKRKPSLIYSYSNRFKKLPFSYSLNVELGKWERDKKNAPGSESMHRNYKLQLTHNPIILPGKWIMSLGAGYEITQETFNDSDVRGFSYNVGVAKEFDKTWAGYASFDYSAVNSQNSLFNFNTNDYARVFRSGVSYRLSDKDRFVCGMQYDLERNTLRDVDYYWYHDIHCSQLILRYRAKRDSWQVKWQFCPW